MSEQQYLTLQKPHTTHHTDVLQIHKASAGSGKTYTLTRQYLKLLLGEKITDGERRGAYQLRPLTGYGYGKPKHHGEILAVTFTNKATEEMTNRIINELATLAGNFPGKKSPYETDFLRDFDTDRSTLARHARVALQDLLFNFSWFNVSTIDSFFQRVLNTFTRELDLSPTHGLELDDRFPLEVAVGQMLTSIRTDYGARGDEERERNRRFLIRWLETYLANLAQSGSNINLFSRGSSLFNDLVDSIKRFFSEKYRMNSAPVDGYLADAGRIVDFAQAIGNDGTIRQLRQDTMQAAAAVLATQDPLLSANTIKALNRIVSGDFKGLTATFRANLSDPMKALNKPSKTKPLQQGTVQLIEAAWELTGTYLQRSDLYGALQKWVYYLGLFGHVQRFLEEYRKENDTLLLSDTNDLLHRIINEDETPFIYERMGTAIKHYLIDEFQDTSLMQWDNLRPLVLESLSHEHDNLIIGDEKQCIYRFRNSDPQLLGTKVETLVHKRFNNAIDLKGVRIEENCNWRSAPGVVKFNNSLFAAMSHLLDASTGSKSISTTYAGLVQMFPESHAGMEAYVKAFFIPEKKQTGNKSDDEPSLPGPTDTTPDQLQLLRDEISRQLSVGYHPKDIAILVRTTRQGKETIQYLMDVMENDPSWPHGQIQLMSADSMSIGMSAAVKLIVNVLRLVNEPELATDSADANASYRRYRLIHRFELSRYDRVPVTDADGNPVTGEDGQPLTRPITDSEALAVAVAATSPEFEQKTDELQQRIDRDIDMLAAMDSPTLAAMTDRIIDRFLSRETRCRENAFITAFQDLVLDYTEEGDNTVGTFLEWWDRVGCNANVQSPDGLDAISVMTIHKAKGLEFSCVHVPSFSFDMVNYHSPFRKSISWYTLDTSHFPGIDPHLVPPMLPLPNISNLITLPAFATEGKAWITEQTTDTLNVAYVALTRAVRELCVYVDDFAPATNDKSSNIGQFMHDAIASLDTTTLASLPLPDGAAPYMEPLSTWLRDDPTGMEIFEYGEPTAPENNPMAEQPDSTGEETTGEIPSGPHRLYDGCLDEYFINEHSEICASTDFEDLVSFDLGNERHKGIFLHNVLSGVRHISDLHRALEGMAYRYRISQEEKEECRSILEDALADGRVRPWFEDYTRVVTERGITSDKGVRRPDRVVWLPNGSVHVIDYKFGALHPAAYRRQVSRYVDLLRRAGHTDVHGYLWYPLEGEITEID